MYFFWWISLESTIMAWNIFSQCIFCLSIFFLLELASCAQFLSYGILELHVSTGRTILQAKKSCSVDFQNKNYTILTSRCKGPNYTPDLCCNALKDFACPFAESINDLTTDCATTMFSYINMYGKYPPGLFANMCKEDKEGLSCPESAFGLRITPSVSMLVAGGIVRLLLKLL